MFFTKGAKWLIENMRRLRLTYFILTIATIITGLLSRHFKFIPLFIGDILWALMVYFIVRFLFIYKPSKSIIIASLLFCYAIEFSQLYKAPWINELRHTIFGKLVLGAGFLWSDLLCYTVGVGIGVLLDLYAIRKKIHTSF
jgi:predicted neutral ceramidase superfamily lipid hydrolase